MSPSGDVDIRPAFSIIAFVPTIPLYDMSAADQGWHEVRAPGGFEAWTLQMELPGQPIPEFAVGFFDGFPFHPKYRRKFGQYLRNPTRVIPPTPREYPCVFFSIFRRNIPLDAVAIAYPAGSLFAAKDCLDVSIGPNRIAKKGGVLSVQLKFQRNREFEIEIDASMAGGVMRFAGRRTEFKNCPVRFEHVFSAVPPKGDALSRFNCKQRIIKAPSAASSAYPASRRPGTSRASASAVERLEGREII